MGTAGWLRLRSWLLFSNPKKGTKKAGSSASGTVKTDKSAAFIEGSLARSVSSLAGLHASTCFIQLLLGFQLFS